jgi:rod shape-determining protein MreB
MSVQGRDLLTGKPKQVEVSYREIAKALDKSIQRIEDAVMETLSQTPPELLQIFTIQVFILLVEDQC